jgi:hypothetical protein
MVKIWTLSRCFEHFGALCANSFSRSAISKDGRTVVVAMWEDEFGRDGNRITYETRYRPAPRGKRRGADSEWAANLIWARTHCDGLVRVVVLTAMDVTANPRTILYCHPDESLIMRITHLDVGAGLLRAESV